MLFYRKKQFITYFWEKRTELQKMDERDALLGKVVVDIHRKRSHSSGKLVPLYSVLPIHPINRESALATTRKRIDALEIRKAELTEKRDLTADLLVQYIPSVSAIKVVMDEDDSYIAFEGNGRLAALQTVFEKNDDIHIEVEQYHFNEPQKIIRRMNRVRKMHNLRP